MVKSLVEGARYFLPMNFAAEVDRCTRTDSPYFRDCLINVADFGVHVMMHDLLAKVKMVMTPILA